MSITQLLLSTRPRRASLFVRLELWIGVPGFGLALGAIEVHGEGVLLLDLVCRLGRRRGGQRFRRLFM